MGKSKKSKDGGNAVFDNGGIWALKGGNTQEFWRYDVVAGTWAEKDTIPAFGTTGKKKKVKAGGDIVAFGGEVFFATKGNKTLEFWRYVAPGETVFGSRPARSGVLAGPQVLGRYGFRLAPNPLGEGPAVLSYSLPQAGPVMLTVFDVTGRSVVRQTLATGRTGTARLELGELAAGVYLVKLEAEGLKTAVKLVVE